MLLKISRMNETLNISPGASSEAFAATSIARALTQTGWFQTGGGTTIDLVLTARIRCIRQSIYYHIYYYLLYL